MPNKFEYEFPLFIVLREIKTDGASATFESLATLEAANGIKSLAVFTDQAGAEEYRDRHLPGYILFAIPDEEVLLGVLTMAHGVFTHIAFDPWKLGKGVQTVALDQWIEKRT